MKFILGAKKEMTQIFDKDGTCYPATVLSAGPLVVTHVRTKEKEGYSALQLGFGVKKGLSKAEKGHRKGLGDFRYLREIRLPEEEITAFKVGDKIDASLFSEGDKVLVSGVSKGKGFQGVVKRHGFGGGRRTHGQKHSEREPGSIGGGGRAGGRVVKGMKMAGRMGGGRVTVKNLTVLKVLPDENILLVSGAVPGRKGTLIEVRGV